MKLRLKHGDMSIWHTIYNVYSCDYEVGDTVKVIGWQEKDSLHNSLYVKLMKSKVVDKANE